MTRISMPSGILFHTSCIDSPRAFIKAQSQNSGVLKKRSYQTNEKKKVRELSKKKRERERDLCRRGQALVMINGLKQAAD